jgi:hypothetical protein
VSLLSSLVVLALCPKALLDELGITPVVKGGGRFRSEMMCDLEAGYKAAIEEPISVAQGILDMAIEELYAQL